MKVDRNVWPNSKQPQDCRYFYQKNTHTFSHSLTNSGPHKIRAEAIASVLRRENAIQSTNERYCSYRTQKPPRTHFTLLIVSVRLVAKSIAICKNTNERFETEMPFKS